jgi:RHS repeat-associated protein
VLRPDQSQIPSGGLFPAFNYSCNQLSCYPHTQLLDIEVVKAVTLPDNRQYKYYYNLYTELARVELPTGSFVDYDYTGVNNADSSGIVLGPDWFNGHPETQVPHFIYRRVAQVKTFESANNLVNVTKYSGIGIIAPVTVTIENNNNEVISKSKHYYYNDPNFLNSNWIAQSAVWNAGIEYKTEFYSNPAQENPTTTIEHIIVQQPPSWWNSDPLSFFGPEPINNPRLTEIKQTLDTGLVSKQTFNYDQYNNITDTYYYDWGQGSEGQLLKRTHTDYITDSAYTSFTGACMRGLPSQKWVSSDSAGNNKVSLIQYEYDNYSSDSFHAPLVDRQNMIGHISSFNINYTTRGNVTKVTSYANAQNATDRIIIASQYDIAGNVVKEIDAKGNAKTVDYSDRFGIPDGEARTNTAPSVLNGSQTFAFATGVTNQMGYTSYTQVDYYTALIVDAEDINENVSTSFYNDMLERPTQIIVANNRPALRRQQTFAYDDLNRKKTVTSDLYAFGDNLAKTEMLYDRLGRVFETRNYEENGYVVTQQTYNALGRVDKTSNPYRPYLSEPLYWTTTEYDSMGRVTKVKTPDDAEATTSFSGNATTITDPAGKKRRQITNALGQLIRIDEPNNQNELGDIDTPNQPTFYSYNANGLLVKVAQGQQNRFFLYDSVGRLLRVRQPEQIPNSALAVTDPITGNGQWTSGSTYDANGNTLTTTDAKGVVITQTYDSLDRVLTRAYSDLTPSVTHTYDDPNVPFSKGQLTKISSSVSTTEYTAFDSLGNVLSHRQTTDGQSYTTSYTYNLSGALIEEVYPSGRVVKNVFDNEGKLSEVSSKAAGQNIFCVYANNFAYTASGMMSQMRFGNGRWETLEFNSRLQVTQISLGTSQNATNLWKVNYDYGEIDTGGNLNVQKNNGSIARQTINFSGLTQPFTQSYQYDLLSRLKEAKEVNGTQETWQQNFDYDRYGNRISFNQVIGQQQVSQTPQIDPATNRFSTGQGFVYDFNGNLIQDNQGRSFTFNGDNRQIEVKDANNNVIGLYYYDGEGKRVKKVSNTETTIFVYDAEGKLIAEYSSGQPSNSKTSYLTVDVLGSPRVITDSTGQVISRRDFMPFGEELYAGTTNRTASSKYSISGVDGVRKRFTGYEKDSETGLDFAEARYYNNAHGRFTAVDPLLASGDSADPQSFNRYVYVSNNPVTLTDPTGLCINCVSGSSVMRGDIWYTLGQEWGMFTSLANNPLNLVSNSELYIVDRTTTYRTSAESPGLKANIVVTVKERIIVDASNKTIVGDSNPVINGTATSVGRDPISQTDLNTYANIAATVVKVAMQNNFDPTIALGIAKTETQFGLNPNKEKNSDGTPVARKISTVNPMQLSYGKGVATGDNGLTYQQALEQNIKGALDRFNLTPGKDLNTQLQNYNNQASKKVAYANKAEGYINDIRNSRTVVNVTVGKFSSFITPTRIPALYTPCSAITPCPQFQ